MQVFSNWANIDDCRKLRNSIQDTAGLGFCWLIFSAAQPITIVPTDLPDWTNALAPENPRV